ncbi:hypothetical protein [Cellulomonas sp. C5510]|uniref:hypothetical protein n=1 Tax=Cellulomonas sp. C5510 TaxID=2871170 RepID=UPI001C96719B|nr:hypothetical protein [Cellulomonas sp. C5510]QZN86895.1 hypothetical protein K5O09_07230 [Cellulomonas sp. C5510]
MRKSARLRYMTDPNPDGTPGAQPPAPRTFTQDEVTAMMTREKADGRTAATREITEKLGGISIEDAAALIEAARKADEANQTQAQRDAAAAATAKAEAEQIKAEAAADRHAARVERLLGSAGATNVAIAARALDVAVGADEATVTAAITQLKTDAPGLFGTGTPAPHTAPGAPPAQPPAAKTAQERADEVAARRGYRAPAA